MEWTQANGFHQMIRLPASKSYRIKGNQNSFVDVDDLKAIYSTYVQITPDFIDIEAPAKPNNIQSNSYQIHLKANNRFSEWYIPIHARYQPFASTPEGIVPVELAEICLLDGGGEESVECQVLSTMIPHGIDQDARLATLVTFVAVCGAFLVVVARLVRIANMNRREKNKTE